MWLTRRDEGEAFWSYQDLAIFLGLALPCFYVGILIVKWVLIALYISTPNKTLVGLPGQFLGYALLFNLLAWILRMEYERPFWQSLGWRRPNYPLVAIIVTGVGLAFALAMLGAVLKAPEAPEPMREMLSDRASVITMAFLGVTFGPLCEELAFRGFMQPLFVRSWGVATGIFVSALGFGLAHLPEYGNSWKHGVIITLAGCAFGWMRWISGSTMGSTMMHAAYNLTLFLGYFAGGSKIHQSW